MRLSTLFIAFLLAATVAAAGCGGGDEGGSANTGGATDVSPRGDPITGRDAFILGTKPHCGDCHTLADAGSTGTVGPNLDELKPSFDQVIAALNTGPGAMPSFKEISPSVKDSLAAYVSTAAGQGG
jgi:mono/diheme cytochrome c family protein